PGLGIGADALEHLLGRKRRARGVARERIVAAGRDRIGTALCAPLRSVQNQVDLDLTAADADAADAAAIGQLAGRSGRSVRSKCAAVMEELCVPRVDAAFALARRHGTVTIWMIVSRIVWVVGPPMRVALGIGIAVTVAIAVTRVSKRGSRGGQAKDGHGQ